MTSVPVDEAGETDRDQIMVVSVFALCLVEAEVADRAACPPPSSSTGSDRIRSTDDGKETREGRLGER